MRCWNRLANAAAILLVIDQQLAFDAEQPRSCLYGDGHAAEAIVACLLRWIQLSDGSLHTGPAVAAVAAQPPAIRG